MRGYCLWSTSRYCIDRGGFASGRNNLCTGPIVVKAGVWTVCEWLHTTGWSQFYDSKEPKSIRHILYVLACVLIMDYLHDAWFYWTHRLLHWKPLYRHVHYVHHKCALLGANHIVQIPALKHYIYGMS